MSHARIALIVRTHAHAHSAPRLQSTCPALETPLVSRAASVKLVRITAARMDQMTMTCPGSFIPPKHMTHMYAQFAEIYALPAVN
jgi:hypothetical protein